MTRMKLWLIPMTYATVTMLVGFAVPRLEAYYLPPHQSAISIASAQTYLGTVASGTLARTAEVVEYLHHLNLAVDQSALDPADRVTACREVRQGLGLSRGQVFALSADMPHGRD